MRRVFRLPLGRRQITREVDDELSFHFETRIERLVSQGWKYDDARREALRQFGDVTSVRQSMVTMDEQRERATRRANMLSELHQDVGYAVRTLKRNLGFTAIIVGALAVGIGANTAIFTLIDAVLVRALPVAHPEQLVSVGDPTRVGSLSQGSPRTDLLSLPLYRDVAAQNQVFSGVLASGRAGRVDARIDESHAEFEHPHGRFVSGTYFSVLGIKPLVGRVFDASMDSVDAGFPVVVISHGYWTRRFKNDPAVLGRQILVNGVKVGIIGITPESFTGEIVGQAYDMWIPMTMHDAMAPNAKYLADRSSSWLLVLGRLKPNATLAQAKKQIPAIIEQSIVAHSTPQNAAAFLGRNRKYFVQDGAKGFSRFRDTFHAPLLTLMIGVALLLCIICANVANLLLARAVARGREMAVRLALGADRSRLIRQLMTESLVLAGIAAAAGLFIAWWGSRGLLALASDGPTVPIALGMDLPVLGFTLVLSVLAVGLFGLAPALRASRVDLASTMRSNAHSVTGSALGGRGQRAGFGKVLIAGQVALSIVLLVGATMLVRSLRNVQNVDVGLDRDHLVIADVDIHPHGYKGAELASLVRSVRDKIAAIPGVDAVSYSENGIFSGTESGTNVEIAGFVAKTPDDSLVAYDQVGAGYFKAIGAHVLAGHDMSPADEDVMPHTAVVNQAFAKFYFPNKSAVGQFMHFSDSVAVEIVGVVADTRDHDLTAAIDRRIFFPYIHPNDPANLGEAGSLRFVVHTTGAPTNLVRPVRQAIVSVNPALPVDAVDALTTLMSQSIADQELVARLASGFGVLALLLAAVGLYGVMTYAITRRTGEIGLRVALGAARSDVMRMVLGDALRLVGVGVVVGLGLALVSTRLLSTQLHDVGTTDPISIGVAVGVLTLSAIAAVALPALRASRVSPIVALRAD